MTRAIRRRWWHGLAWVLVHVSSASSQITRKLFWLQTRAFARFIRAGG